MNTASFLRLSGLMMGTVFSQALHAGEHALHPADVIGEGRTALEVGFASQTTSATFSFGGFSGRQESDRSIYFAEGRFGVSDSVELYAALPYHQEKDVFSGVLFGSAVEERSCFADASVGVAWLAAKDTDGSPDLKLGIDHKAKTADELKCGDSYSSTTFSAVLAKRVNQFRPYVSVDLTNNSDGTPNATIIEGGFEYTLSDGVSIGAAIGQTTWDSELDSEKQTASGYDLRAIFRIAPSVWLGAVYSRYEFDDFNLLNPTVRVSNADADAIGFVVQSIW